MERVSVATRIKCWWKDIPLLTRCIFITCIVVFVTGILPAGMFCLSPYEIWRNPSKVYTFFTSAYLHAGIFHILLNLMFFISCSPVLERTYGTGAMFLTTVVMHTLAGLLCTAIPLALHFGLPDVHVSLLSIHSCTLGLSGLLFSYLVVQCAIDEIPYRSLWCITVPTAAYPWCLLLILQLLFSSVSLAGHAAGILAGYAAIWWVLKIPFIANADNIVPSSIKSMDSYKMAPSNVLYTHHTIVNAQAASTSSTDSGTSMLGRIVQMAQPTQPVEKFKGEGRVLGSGKPPSRDQAPPTQPTQPHTSDDEVV
eukprot:TRINITY_DN57073_c0_g1_i1.p1 TRINITY_DN57073_c0_g1~~TRINITY_DN57073_c0_g1_i1.p1  ORF type:complete len:310 (-),score=-11.90 TRINITY_DN57073_c0_g1_i1:74-1003(-)